MPDGTNTNDQSMINDDVLADISSTSTPSDTPASSMPPMATQDSSEETDNTPEPQSVDLPSVEPATTTASPSFSTSSATTGDDLLSIKRKALEALQPLVSHLDQSPEERFKTLMMMIQASDNKSLIPTAHQAAMSITDEKVKAQALLDVINEINYFTQQAA